jgi:hypothetical protein
MHPETVLQYGSPDAQLPRKLYLIPVVIRTNNSLMFLGLLHSAASVECFAKRWLTCNSQDSHAVSTNAPALRVATICSGSRLWSSVLVRVLVITLTSQPSLPIRHRQAGYYSQSSLSPCKNNGLNRWNDDSMRRFGEWKPCYQNKTSVTFVIFLAPFAFL